ncbi:hypothetical protein [Aureimonas phyllosphaerae]|uniref:Antifreeze protein n=1 Tax=Aureimonas phyllosphaerae TaxID=1166078 RepID=A0A7W6BPK5_9HYPH|nr:hypothetical protein [Aureimonas phyllosphaerae]MBB3935749.1 hypothetical protein [Aureimonas phyllosphaerae]MBB3959757.1 hypothetical protein [Aureimonas phyllosphaerae]SFF14657.1 hypothetical protein SAMN05216566_103288 [Aureimonas phyllosphaerae]
MLSSFIRSTLVAATVLGSLGAASAASAAPRDAAGVTLVDYRGERHDRWEHRGPRHGERWGDRGPHRGERWGDRGPRRGECSPRLALRKARDMGVRGADVVRVNNRAVVVAGYKRGYPTSLRFAQDRGCPVIGYR